MGEECDSSLLLNVCIIEWISFRAIVGHSSVPSWSCRLPQTTKSLGALAQPPDYVNRALSEGQDKQKHHRGCVVSVHASLRSCIAQRNRMTQVKKQVVISRFPPTTLLHSSLHTFAHPPMVYWHCELTHEKRTRVTDSAI